MQTLLRLGLTGGIGSGKSTVARMLESVGMARIDADEIARECTQVNGQAVPKIAQHFGPAFVTTEGAMDRARMREHVFTHPKARLVLESIIHPLVQQEVRRLSELLPARNLVFDIPLLAESQHWRHGMDRILVVDCRTETQIQRVMVRNGWGEDVVKAIIRQQTTRRHRLASADAVLWNDGDDLARLEYTVRSFASQLGL